MAVLAGKFKLTVGLKVAAAVIVFETVVAVAYFAFAQVLVDKTRILEFADMSRRDIIAILLISSLVMAGYLTYMVITRIFSPVAQLTRVTEEIIRGNLDLRLQIHTNDELQVLAERFNAMAAALKTERANLERKVKERTQELETSQKQELEQQKEVVKLKDELLFVAAHELRTPVTAIRWSLESLDAKKMTKEAYRQAVQDAMNASRDLAALVEDLLNMSRLDSKRIEFKKELVDLRAVAKAVVADVGPTAKGKKITLAVQSPPHQTIDALADGRRVREVLMNLVVNAIKFGREGGHVTVRLEAIRDTARLDVVDDGPGIEPDEQRHLFEKFWRSKSQSGVEGSGLGLFITKRLVEGMSGTIAFESAPGKGTAFTVTLPLEPHQLLNE